MLKTRDLNEGNRILIPERNGSGNLVEHTISLATVKDTILDTYGPENGAVYLIYPIPITPKLLTERCGMPEGDGTFNSLSTQDGTINIIRAFIPNGGYVFCYKGIKVPLEGLHHLQNLYYNIFRGELKIQ